MTLDPPERTLILPEPPWPSGLDLVYGYSRGLCVAWSSMVVIDRVADGGPRFATAQREEQEARLEMRVLDVEASDGSFHALFRHVPISYRIDGNETLVPAPTLVYVLHDRYGRVLESTDVHASPVVELPEMPVAPATAWQEIERSTPPRRVAPVEQVRENRVAAVEPGIIRLVSIFRELSYDSDDGGDPTTFTLDGHGSADFDRSWGGFSRQHRESRVVVRQESMRFEVTTAQTLERVDG